jgi:ABC-type multidrug transport system fused ATPase/permease subunit
MSTIERICINQYNFVTEDIATMVISALIGSTYGRALRLSPTGSAQIPAGKIITHLSADIGRIAHAVSGFHLVWIQVLVVPSIVTLLCLQLGPAGVVGALVFVILAPLQTLVTKVHSKLRRRSTQYTEERTKVLHSLLSAMSTIKMFAHQEPHVKRLEGIRLSELKGLRKISLLSSLNEAISSSMPNFAAVFAPPMYSGLGTPSTRPSSSTPLPSSTSCRTPSTSSRSC